MNQILIVLISILIILILVMLYLWKGRKRTKEKLRSRSLNQSLQHLITQDQYEYYLVDVRSEAEYKKGHIPTAINMPYGRLASYLPSDNLFSNIVVYGRSPMQSSRAANILSNNGYFKVTSFGPIFRWRGNVTKQTSEK